MKVRKSLQEILTELQVGESINRNIVHWHTIEEKEAQTDEMPEDLSGILKNALERRGISRLYTHQKSSYEQIMGGQSIVAVTPTASGKTLCYNLPVLQSIINDPNARALYMFPTKALAQDQKSEINELIHVVADETR